MLDPIATLRDKGIISAPFAPDKKAQTDNYVEPVKLPGAVDLSSIFTMDDMQRIRDSVFGPKKSKVEQAEEVVDNSISGMFERRKEALEQQRTEDVKMARYNALGNLLTTLVQPLGWAAGGSTAGVQPYDNRQYLEAFNRAVKASDDIRNIGAVEDEYRLNRAEKELQRARVMDEYEQKERLKAQLKSDYAAQRFEEEMAKIDARGEKQMNLAQFKASFKVSDKNRVPVEEKLLSAAWTQYMSYKKQYDTDNGRGLPRTEEKFPSFAEWIGSEFGWTTKAVGASSGNTGSGSGNADKTGDGNKQKKTAKL